MLVVIQSADMLRLPGAGQADEVPKNTTFSKRAEGVKAGVKPAEADDEDEEEDDILKFSRSRPSMYNLSKK